MKSAATAALRIEHLDVVYGLVGESGCGKSTVALAAIRYLARNGRVSAGRILVDGRDLMALSPLELRRLRTRSVSMVYQDPARALNPTLRIGAQMAEVFEVSEGLKGRPAQARVLEMLARVQIASPDRVLRISWGRAVAGSRWWNPARSVALPSAPKPSSPPPSTVKMPVRRMVKA